MTATASDVLAVWERGLSAPPGRRALELAGLAESDPGGLTVGERDATLLHLRETLFGATIDGIVACAACSEPLEVTTTTGSLLAAAPPPVEAAVALDGWEVRLRPATAADLAAPDLSAARLLAACVEEARHDGQAVDVTLFPPEVVAAVDEALAAADPLADLEFAATCPTCGRTSTTRFDIASFLWAEVDRFALGLLREIHVLASAYGWTEDEILALGQRRRLYLELVEG